MSDETFVPPMPHCPLRGRFEAMLSAPSYRAYADSANRWRYQDISNRIPRRNSALRASFLRNPIRLFSGDIEHKLIPARGAMIPPAFSPR
ncbi:hypothetical protein [Pararhizobium haloflavum]|uniref:hypothetical protein n=1 Tax=Pararhizobium haloflavum TaxID=2037914 RepID=UPI0012FFF84B|nr:hypothetical protein [Pararhizobium haloflavum]